MTDEQLPLFEVERHTHDGIDLGETFNMDPEIPQVPAEQAADTDAPDDFSARNNELMKVVGTGGLLSLVNKREQAVRMRGQGWTPPRLREYAEDKGREFPEYGEEIEENRDSLKSSYNRTLTKACGMCALSNDCELAGRPDLFAGRFNEYSTRKKLERSLNKDPQTKCDEIKPRQSRR